MPSAGDLVTKLPQRLLNFFARYPPQIYSAAVRSPPGPADANTDQAHIIATTPSELESPETPSPYTASRDAKGAHRPSPALYSPSRALLYSDPEYPNPFLPQKDIRTGTWMGARIGLRRQAELVKLAAKYDVEALLPSGRKSTEYREVRRAERGGLAVKGTGVGQKVKGHLWERTMESKLEDRRKAMEGMPEMIRLWKQRGHGRGWTKWPKRRT